MHRSRLVFGIASVVTDFAAIVGAMLLSRVIREHGDFIPFVQLSTGYIPSVGEFLPFVTVAALLLVAILASQGAYDLHARRGFLRFAVKLFFLSIAWLMMLFSYFYLTKDTFFSRIVLVYGWALSGLFILCGRSILRSVQDTLLRRGYGRERIALIGSAADAERVSGLLGLNQHYEIVGTVAADISPEELERWCMEYRVDELIQVQSSRAWPVAKLALFCATRHIHFRSVPDAWQIDEMNMGYVEEAGVPMIELRTTSLEGWGRVVKRVFDTLVSGFALVVISPVLLLIALLVKSTSRGPVLFRHQRVGYHGRPFPMWKFRSMVENAEELKADLMKDNQREGPLFKIKDDPRITPIGRILRRTSLDELPQLANVFLGHMSLVGPRPHLPDEIRHYEEHQRMLLSVKPGMTGMAQVHGRSGLAFADEVRLDMYYVRNWSLWLDLRIILRTFLIIMNGKNAD